MEVDHPSAWGLVGTAVQVLAVQVREEDILVLRVAGDETLRLLGGQDEAHTEDDGTLEGLVRICREFARLSFGGARYGEE